LDKVNVEFKKILTKEKIHDIVSLIPDDWIEAGFSESPEEVRNVYSNFLNVRLENANLFVNEAQHARQSLI
jgi:hypothetical protein